MTEAVLDPTGGQGAVTATAAVRASRPKSLRGTTIALLENTKQNAALFLDELGALLTDQYGVRSLVRRTKQAFALPVPEDMLKELAAECDAVITGVGDCGSCSASAVADGIAFENAGIPATVVCSDAFTVTADAMAKLQGAPDYHYLTTAHPVAVLDRTQVAERARLLLPEVVAGLTASGRT
jgi:hypothetical protein